MTARVRQPGWKLAATAVVVCALTLASSAIERAEGAPCNGSRWVFRTFSVETEWNKRSYRPGEKARVEVAVTRPGPQDPGGFGLSVPSPLLFPAEDVTVSTTLMARWPFPWDRAVTDADGKAALTLRIPKKWKGRTDPILKTVSAPVPAVTEEVRALVEDMLHTMYAAPGIGLAAVQIGVAKRVVVIDVAKDDEPKSPVCFINPEIVWRSEETTEYEEGCLSIPEVYDKVVRPAEVRVRYLNGEGNEREMHCTGLLATCIQHEIDHINGVLFIDHLSRLKRYRIVKKFIKAAKLDKEEA